MTDVATVELDRERSTTDDEPASPALILFYFLHGLTDRAVLILWGLDRMVIADQI